LSLPGAATPQVSGSLGVGLERPLMTGDGHARAGGFVATLVLTAIMGRQPGAAPDAHECYQTPVSVLLAHLACGAILGAFYALP
jgi:hypothetical protein